MAFSVEFDRPRQWIYVHVTGSLSLADALDVIRTARADTEHQMWPMLVDACGIQNSITLDEVDRAVEAVGEAARTQGLRGYVALVADTDSLFDRFLVYEVRCAQIGVAVIRVFRNERDARQWLETMSAARRRPVN
jgi:hypothetical protein